MKRLFLILIFAGIIAPATLNAQKVYNSGGKVILDMSVAAGFPSGAQTNIPKYSGSQFNNPINNGQLHADNFYNGAINATVYEKLEIAPHDLSSAAGTMTGTSVDLDWASAFKACRTSSYDGGGWRLPTQRELILIWIFRTAIESELLAGSGSAFYEGKFQSSTESSANWIWFVEFSTSSSYVNQTGDSGLKETITGNHYARCVREL